MCVIIRLRTRCDRYGVPCQVAYGQYEGVGMFKGLTNKKGFTLVELMVVLILIGLISGILFSRSHQSNAALAGETALLKSYLRFVQALAMADNTRSWGIKIESNKYTLLENAAVSGNLLPDAGSAERTIPSDRKVTISSISPNDTITFDAWGSPGSQSYTITLSDGANPARNITVTQNTGFIQ